MGKTKITVIDDSAAVGPTNKKSDFERGVAPRRDHKTHRSFDPAEGGTLARSGFGDTEETGPRAESEQLKEASGVTKAPGSPQETRPHFVQDPQNDEKQDKKPRKPGKRTKIRSKKYKEALAKVDRNKIYSLDEALNLVKETSYSKYPGSLEIHINTNVKNLRGLVSLPFASGKKLAILAFGPSAGRESTASRAGQVKELEDLKAVVGTDETIDEIGKGKINFDVLITTPEWMPKLAKVAKNLGPRGLMPNPKNGTITDNLKKAVTEIQSGKTEYKSEKNLPVLHLAVGKIDQPETELNANIKTLLTTIGKTKIKKVTLSPSLGPGVKVDFSSL